MCAGALLHARIARLVYGADDPKAGAVRSVMALLENPVWNHRVEVTAGLLGAYWVATAQEGGSPWPRPPVRTEGPGPQSPAAPAKNNAGPVPSDAKAPANEKKSGPIRKFIARFVPQAFAPEPKKHPKHS